MNHKSKKAQIADLASQYGRQVFSTAFRLLGDKHLAEDVTQDVFLKLFKKPPQAFDNINNWSAYLKTMATSAAIDQLRRRTRLAEESIETAPLLFGNEQASHSEGPYQSMAIDRDLIRFRESLAHLSSLEADIFCLRFLEEFSYQEIADQLGITNSRVGVTLHRAQQKLLQQVGESQFLGAGYETN